MPSCLCTNYNCGGVLTVLEDSLLQILHCPLQTMTQAGQVAGSRFSSINIIKLHQSRKPAVSRERSHEVFHLKPKKRTGESHAVVCV